MTHPPPYHSSAPLSPKTSLSLLEANWIGTIAGLLGGIILVIPHWLLWGGFFLVSLTPSTALMLLAFVLVSIVVHEALHGLGWLLAGRIHWSDISFGFKSLTPFAHCSVPVTARAYRIGVIFPALILGGVPLLVGTLFNIEILTIWGSLMVMVSGGDLAVLWAIRSIPAPVLVTDHPSRVGCEIVT